MKKTEFLKKTEIKKQFWDIYYSPTAFRDWKAMLGGIRIGLIMTLTHGFVLGTLICVVILNSEDRSIRNFFSQGDLGGLFNFSSSLGLFVGITLFAPFYLLGIFEAPRWKNYFDQIVVTGLSPFSYILGRIFTGMTIIGLMVLNMFPYFVFAESLGSIDEFHFLYSLFLCMYWGLVLMVFFVTISLIFHEFMSLVAVLCFAFFFAFLGVMPVPGILGGLSPTRFLILQNANSLFTQNSSSSSEVVYVLYNYASLGYWNIPIFLYTPLMFTLLLYLCYRFLKVGPRHTLIPGLNNFGVVALPGDHKKKGFFRMRFHLKRQMDRFFFFENVPHEMNGKEKEAYRRSTRFFVVNLFCFYVVLGGLGYFWHYLKGSGGISPRDFFEVRNAFLLLTLGLYLLATLQTKNEILLEESPHHLRWDLYGEFCYFFLLLLLLFAVMMIASPYLESFQKITFTKSTHYQASLIFYSNFIIDSLYDYLFLTFFYTFPYTFSVFLWGRLLSTYSYSKFFVALWLSFYIFVTLLLFPILLALIEILMSNWSLFREDHFIPLAPLFYYSKYYSSFPPMGFFITTISFIFLSLFNLSLLKKRITRLKRSSSLQGSL